MSHHIIEIKDLQYAYPDGTAALNGVSCRMLHGEAVAVVGANGAGKSTFLSHLNGLLVPTGGQVRIGDYPVTKDTLKHIRRTVGMVFQNPDEQLFMPTVFEDVAFGPLNLGLPAEEVKKRVEEALEQVGAVHLKERPPYKLSGGQKRAVAIASVLSMLPDILVLDEPTAGLDAKARRQLLGLLKSFTHTKIIATHDLDLVLDICPRTIVLKDGQIAADGPTTEIFQNQPLLAAASLELPFRLQACPRCSQ